MPAGALQHDHFALDAAGDPRVVIADEHVDLRAHAEVREIDPGLHGETAPGHDAPLVVSFEIIHVGAVAMDLDTDRVSSAVGEELGVPGFGNHRAAGVIHFEAAQRLALRDGGLHACDGCVTRVAHGGKYAAHLVARIVAAECGPGDVVVDRAGLIEFGPHIEKHPIAALYG